MPSYEYVFPPEDAPSRVRLRPPESGVAKGEALRPGPEIGKSERSSPAPAMAAAGRPAPFLASLALAFIGGAAGGVIGGAAMLLNLGIVTSASPPWIKLLAIFAVSGSTFALLVPALLLIRSAFFERGGAVR